MRNICLIFLAACCSVQQVHAQGQTPAEGRNPFISTQPLEKSTKPIQGLPTGSNAALEGPRILPDFKPGLYAPSAAQALPLPPPGFPRFVLPPPVAHGPATIPAPPRSKVPDSKEQPSADESKTDVFLSRAQLLEQRSKCAVSLKSVDSVRIAAEGGRILVRLAVTGGRQCVKGLASSAPWLRTSSMSEAGELAVTVDFNEANASRDADISVANTGTSLTIRIIQTGNLEAPGVDL